MNTVVKTVALYARVSTRDRDQNPDTQMLPLREYAAARGWEVREYVDKASAKDLRGRRSWRQLLTDARLHQVDLVLVWKLDRMARSTLDALTTLQQLDGWGVGFRSMTQDIDTTTSTGRLVFTILAAVAEMEREMIRERVKAGMDRARGEGKHVGRPTRKWTPAQHQLWPKVLAGLTAGTMTRREAAKRLGVGYRALQIALADVGIEAGLRKGGHAVGPSINSETAA